MNVAKVVEIERRGVGGSRLIGKRKVAQVVMNCTAKFTLNLLIGIAF